MSLKIDDREFHLIRNYIEVQCGISLGHDKKYLVESRLGKLVAANDCKDFAEFYKKATGAEGQQLQEQIVDAITTNETMWFRDKACWKALEESVLPELFEAALSRSAAKVRFWSAACSTGQEPYSLAMILDDLSSRSPASKISPDGAEIMASDISSNALFVAKSGMYDRISMRRGFDYPHERFRAQYFKQEGRVSAIAPSIKARVYFEKINLLSSFHFPRPFDMIFLRNVAIYFADEFKQILFDKLAQCIRPGGLLLLGSAESPVGYSTKFTPEEFGRAIIYRRCG